MRATRAAIALAMLAVVGCGTSGTAQQAALAPDAERRQDSAAMQVANGPVAFVATRPLAVKLAAAPDPVRVRFKRPPRSALLFDLDTGEVLWRRQPTRIMPIASLTKMMTALVVADRLAPDAKVRVTKESLAYKGTGLGVLPRGKRIRAETMLNGLILPSGNDAAIALAQRISGTVAGFVALMNARAAEMNLACTRFSSPDGFKDDGNHSCAADLAAIARAVLDEPRVARIVKRRRAILPFPIKGGRIHLYSHNPLVRHGYPGALGIKTGYTSVSGRCFVGAARRNGRRLGVVLLHSPDPGRQATQLLNRGFAARG
jgi:D-alanyl-D-alanine carboxypeptidase